MQIFYKIVAGLVLAIGLLFLLKKRRKTFSTGIYDSIVRERQYKYLRVNVYKTGKHNQILISRINNTEKTYWLTVPDDTYSLLKQLSELAVSNDEPFCQIIVKEIFLDDKIYVSALDADLSLQTDKMIPKNYKEMMDLSDVSIMNELATDKRKDALIILFVGLILFKWLPLISIFCFVYAFLLYSQNVPFKTSPDANWMEILADVELKQKDENRTTIDEQGLPRDFDDWSDKEKHIYSLYEKYNLTYGNTVYSEPEENEDSEEQFFDEDDLQSKCNEDIEREIAETVAEITSDEELLSFQDELSHEEEFIPEDEVSILDSQPEFVSEASATVDDNVLPLIKMEENAIKQPIDETQRKKPKKEHPQLQKNREYDTLRELMRQEALNITLLEQVCDRAKKMLVSADGDVSLAFGEEDILYFKAFQWTKFQITPEEFIEVIKEELPKVERDGLKEIVVKEKIKKEKRKNKIAVEITEDIKQVLSDAASGTLEIDDEFEETNVLADENAEISEAPIVKELSEESSENSDGEADVLSDEILSNFEDSEEEGDFQAELFGVESFDADEFTFETESFVPSEDFGEIDMEEGFEERFLAAEENNVVILPDSLVEDGELISQSAQEEHTEEVETIKKNAFEEIIEEEKTISESEEKNKDDSKASKSASQIRRETFAINSSSTKNTNSKRTTKKKGRSQKQWKEWE